jgi:hypothetical protein
MRCSKPARQYAVSPPAHIATGHPLPSLHPLFFCAISYQNPQPSVLHTQGNWLKAALTRRGWKTRSVMKMCSVRGLYLIYTLHSADTVIFRVRRLRLVYFFRTARQKTCVMKMCSVWVCISFIQNFTFETKKASIACIRHSKDE